MADRLLEFVIIHAQDTGQQPELSDVPLTIDA